MGARGGVEYKAHVQPGMAEARQAYARLTNLLSIIYKGVKLRIPAPADRLIRKD
jgi:hypothetical protein